jgi:hypothetical protein
MLDTRRFVIVAAGLLVGAWTVPAGAGPTLGQTDGFDDGTLRSWQNGGSRNPNPAANIPSGGPGGTNDRFLQVTSNGSPSAGGKLLVFNTDQWAGDYLAAGVNSIRMTLNNVGPTPVTMRLILVDAFDGQSVATLAPVTVPSGSGWVIASFPLTPANLTGGPFDTVMRSVTELDLVHSPNVVFSRSSAPDIAAQIGVDNIAAVPEPGTAGLAAAVLTGAALRRRRRRPGTCNSD